MHAVNETLSLPSTLSRDQCNPTFHKEVSSADLGTLPVMDECEVPKKFFLLRLDGEVAAAGAFSRPLEAAKVSLAPSKSSGSFALLPPTAFSKIVAFNSSSKRPGSADSSALLASPECCFGFVGVNEGPASR